MLISSFHPLVGGAERQAQRLSKKLIEKGNDVTVLTRWHEGLLAKEKIEGINVVRFKVSKNSKLAPLIYLIKVLKYVRENKANIDIVHAHALSAPGISAAFISKFFKIPSIAKIAGGGGKDGCEIVRMRKSGKIGEMKVDFLKKHLDLFIAISKSIEKDLLDSEIEQNKIVFLPNGIDFNNFYSNNASPNEIFKFVYIGRLEKIKGIDVLLSAWEALSDDFKQRNQLVIAGEGKERILLKGIQKDNIKYIGKQNDILSLLNSSDVFLLPSRYEGISNALLEAMATERIIIASNVGGNIDLINNNNNGLLFESENVNDLIDKITYVSENRERLTKMKKEARNTLKDNYDLQKNVNRYIEIYSRLANPGENRS